MPGMADADRSTEHAPSGARIRVLGPLEVIDGAGAAVALSSSKLRRLLAALVIDAGSVVSADRLADVLWGDDQPEHTAGALQSLVSRLRRRLPASSTRDGIDLVTRAPGYALHLDEGVLDVHVFRRRLDQARATLDRDPAGAARLLDDALAAWRGDAYAEFRDEPFARAEAARLEELRATAREERVAAALAQGATDEAVAMLEVLTADHPMRERPQALTMTALYRAGRQAEALAAFRRYRDLLDRELGLDPSTELLDLERRVLQGDPGLAGPAARRAEVGTVVSDDGGPDGGGLEGGGPDGGGPPEGGTHAEPPVPGRGVPGSGGASHGVVPARPDLIGRDQLGATVHEALDGARIVTLTGPGGVGKTSLAVQVANDRRGAAPDGVWWCELAPVGADGEVAELILTVFDARVRPGMSVLDSVVDLLRRAELLLVLDNAEHVVEGVADLVSAVARACPGVRVLLTSRERVGVDDERVIAVPPLQVPGPGPGGRGPGPSSATDTTDVASGGPAVELFVRRARAAASDFTVDDGNVAAVAEICRRLDGMPLALELAATRMRSMSPADLAGRLTWRFRVLRGGRRGTAERHRTLRAVVDWSYDLLDDTARLVFDRLSVFAGEFPLDAAERVVADTGGDLDPLDVADVLARLVDASMVVARHADGSTTYALLETLRAYGRDRLDLRGETQAARRAHAEHHTDLAEEVARRLYGADNRAQVARLDRAFDELRAAHAWALANDLPLALRMVAGLVVYAEQQSVGEAFAWAERTVEAAERAAAPLPAPWLAGAYGAAAMGARSRGDLARATELARRGIDAAGADEPAATTARYTLIEVALFEGRLDEIDGMVDELERLAAPDLPRGVGLWARSTRLLARSYAGDAGAVAEVERARAAAARDALPSDVAWLSYVLAEALVDADPERGLPLAEDALAYARAYDDRFLTGVALVTAASLQARHGDAGRAVALFLETVTWWHRAGNWMQQWIAVRSIVGLLIRLGADEDAAVLLGAVRSRSSPATVFGADAERLAVAADTLADRLGDATFATACDRGAAMADDAVIAWLRGVLDGLAPHA